MKSAIIATLTSLILLTSCQTTTPANSVQAMASLGYMKDERTGLCFATIGNVIEFHAGVSIACVPCTHEVDSIIQANK